MKNLLFTALICSTIAANAQIDVTKTLEGTYKKENKKSEIRFSGNTFYLSIPTAMAKYIYEGSYSYNTSSITLNIEKYTAVKMTMRLKQTLVFDYVLNEYTLDIIPGQNGMVTPFKWAEGRYYKYQDGNPPSNYAELIAQPKIEFKQEKVTSKPKEKEEKIAKQEASKAVIYDEEKKGFVAIGFSSLLLQPSDGGLKPFIGISIYGGLYVTKNSYVGLELGAHGFIGKEKEVGTFEYTMKGSSQTYTDGKITKGYSAFPILGTWAYAPDLARWVQLNIGPVLGTTLFHSTYNYEPSVENRPNLPKETKAAFNLGGEVALIFGAHGKMSIGLRYRFLGNAGASFADDKFGGTMHQIKLTFGNTFYK